MDREQLPPKSLLLAKLGLEYDAQVGDVKRRYELLVRALDGNHVETSETLQQQGRLSDAAIAKFNIRECYDLLMDDRYWKAKSSNFFEHSKLDRILARHGFHELIGKLQGSDIESLTPINKHNCHEYGLSLLVAYQIDVVLKRVRSPQEALELFLNDLDLSRHVESFRLHGIDIHCVSLLTDEDLTKLGLWKSREKHRILAACKSPNESDVSSCIDIKQKDDSFADVSDSEAVLLRSPSHVQTLLQEQADTIFVNNELRALRKEKGQMAIHIRHLESIIVSDLAPRNSQAQSAGALTLSAAMLLHSACMLISIANEPSCRESDAVELCSSFLVRLALSSELSIWCKTMLANKSAEDDCDRYRRMLQEVALKVDSILRTSVAEKVVFNKLAESSASPEQNGRVEDKDLPSMFEKAAEPYSNVADPKSSNLEYLCTEMSYAALTQHNNGLTNPQKFTEGEKNDMCCPTESEQLTNKDQRQCPESEKIESNQSRLNFVSQESTKNGSLTVWASRAARVKLQTAAIALEAAKHRVYHLLLFEHEKGKRTGLGIMLQRNIDGTYYVAHITEKSIISTSGQIQIDDEIVSIDGFHLEGLPTDVVHALLQGHAGFWIAVVIIPNEKAAKLPRSLKEAVQSRAAIGLHQAKHKFWWCTPCEIVKVHSGGYFIKVTIDAVQGLSFLQESELGDNMNDDVWGITLEFEMDVVQINSRNFYDEKARSSSTSDMQGGSIQHSYSDLQDQNVWRTKQLVGDGHSRISVGTRVVTIEGARRSNHAENEIGTICEVETGGLTCRVRWDSGIISLHDTGCERCFELARAGKRVLHKLAKPQKPTYPVLMEFQDLSDSALSVLLWIDGKFGGEAILPLCDLGLQAKTLVTRKAANFFKEHLSMLFGHFN